CTSFCSITTRSFPWLPFKVRPSSPISTPLFSDPLNNCARLTIFWAALTAGA
ncbi:hypothetical protein COCVIDRAFT_103449, partial [Bipolaris victoriae FI3]